MDRSSRFLIAAQGYLELGMFDDALAELDRLPDEERDSKLATCFHLDLYNAAKDPAEGRATGRGDPG